MKRLLIGLLSVTTILSAIMLLLVWSMTLSAKIGGLELRDMETWTVVTTFNCVLCVFSAIVSIWVAISLINNIKYGNVMRFVLLVISIVPFYTAIRYFLVFLSVLKGSISIGSVGIFFTLSVLLTLITFAVSILMMKGTNIAPRRQMPASVWTPKAYLWTVWVCVSCIGIFILVIIVMNVINASRIPMQLPTARLRSFIAVEEGWKRNDYDRNGINDYWTYDVSCLYRMRDTAGNPIRAITIDIAKADAAFAADNIFGDNYLEPFANIAPSKTTIATSGYYFRAMLRDETGRPYNQNEVGNNKIKAANSQKWAFVAYPEKYGATGRLTYIINEKGIIYGKDTGSDANKVILEWPGNDPTHFGWAKVE